MIGKISAPPKVNSVAPNQRDTNWDSIRSIRNPFPNPRPSEFGFWFNYFWAEAADLESITPAQKAAVAETFASVFEGTAGDFKLRTDFATRGDEFKFNALRQLLLVGFKRVPLQPPGAAPRLRSSKPAAPLPPQAVDAALLNLDHLTLSTGESLPIAFRCDSRSYEELAAQGGFLPRARSHGRAIFSAYGLDRPWNPFAHPAYQDSLFLRLGKTNRDNCLQTVISVGPRFAEITHFPILNDVVLIWSDKSSDGRYLAWKPLDEWTPEDVAKALQSRHAIRAVRDPQGLVEHLEKTNYVHVFHCRGLQGVNTAAFFHGADAFPERGLAAVPADHLLASIEMVQKWWYNDHERKIFLYEIEFGPIRWVPNEQKADTLLGDLAKAKLVSLIQGEITAARSRSFITEQASLRTALLPKRAERIALKAQKLTYAEELLVVDALRDYFRATPGAKPNSRAEKTFVKSRHAGKSALLAKIDAIDPGGWSGYRSAAQRPA